MFNSLDKESDVWTHLAMAMGDEVQVLYWGGERVVSYGEKKHVIWTRKISDFAPAFDPDIIFARGGFPEYHGLLRRYPNAFKIYYGAGKRHLPIKGFSDYQLTLQDSDKQLRRAKKKFPGIKHILWTKPVPPQFYPRDVKKEFDVCYIANGGQADIKRIPWVYKTAPSDLKILHLGIKSKYKPPKNVTRLRVQRGEMPEWISKCRVGVVPYKSIDSAPRALYEMLACGLPLLVCDEVNFHNGNRFGAWKLPLGKLWSEYTDALRYGVRLDNVPFLVEIAANYILSHVKI